MRKTYVTFGGRCDDQQSLARGAKRPVLFGDRHWKGLSAGTGTEKDRLVEAQKPHLYRVEIARMPDALHGYFSLPARFKLVKQTCEIINRFLKD